MTRAAIGFDVGGSHIRACAIWEVDGCWSYSQVEKLRWREDGDATTLEDLAEALERLRATAVESIAVAASEIRIGVGVAAQLDRTGRRVINSPNIGWRDAPLAEVLEQTLGERVRCLNDVDAILVGEHSFGAARGSDDVLAVFVGTGVGGSIVAGGRLIRGTSGKAGEIGHVKVHGSAVPCSCGEVGCVEALSGGAALHRRLAADGRPPSVTEQEAACARGDEYAVALWDEVATALGGVIAGAATLLNPEVVLLGGGVVERAPRLRALVEARATSFTLAASRTTLRFSAPELGDSSGALGAAIHACED